MDTSLSEYKLNHECASTIDLITHTIIHFRNKIRVQMFYFDSNMTVPLLCAALFWKVYVDKMRLAVPCDPNKISFQTIIKLIAQQRLDQ